MLYKLKIQFYLFKLLQLFKLFKTNRALKVTQELVPISMPIFLARDT